MMGIIVLLPPPLDCLIFLLSILDCSIEQVVSQLQQVTPLLEELDLR